MTDCRFIVIGRNCSFGPEASALKNLEWRGDVTNLKTFYGDISLLIVPSLVEEAYTRVVLEAAVNGIPVIANDIGGIPEALGNSGILVQISDDTETMVTDYCIAIARLLGDPALYGEYSARALQKAEEYKRAIRSVSMENCLRYLKAS